TIKDAIESKEEKMLPGLGVLFEIIWEHSNREDQEEMLSTLEQGLSS
ncbi:small acid-soluble spore protein SspI, partial [Priestia endophytica]